ncbi:MAG: hypothetical protein HHAS10_09680 [Candidatus Altimarinota bacterium]
MKKKIPQLKKKLHGFITNEDGSIRRESMVKLSVGGAMLLGGASALPDSANAGHSNGYISCAPTGNTPAINASIGVNTSINLNGHFNGVGSSTHANYGHGNYSTACWQNIHGSHGSCGGGCW